MGKQQIETIESRPITSKYYGITYNYLIMLNGSFKYIKTLNNKLATIV